MIILDAEVGDDAAFTKIAGDVLNKLIQRYAPAEVNLIKIDHWFDFKWRHFEGKFLGAAGSWNSSQLRIPPFIPDRVAEERYFTWLEGEYVAREPPGLHIYQTSSQNITGKRRLVSDEGERLLLWYSGGTKLSMRGSLMSYQVREKDHRTFYVSFVKKSSWQIFKTHGLSRSEANALIEVTDSDS